MISWHATRLATIGESYSYNTFSSSSYSESSTAPGGAFTNITASTEWGATLLFENDVFLRSETSYTSQSYENDAATATQLFTYAEAGATSLNSYSFSSSFSYTYNENGDLGEVTSSTSSSFADDGPLTPAATSFLTSTTSTQGRTFYVTSSAAKLTTITTSTLTLGRATWTTQGTTTLYKTSADTANNPFTSSQNLTITTRTATDATATAPIERGTVYSTNDPQEWFWLATFSPASTYSTNTEGTFVTDLIGSVENATTVWPQVETYTVPLIGISAGETGSSFSRYFPTAATYTVQGIATSGATLTTTTQGDSFSRGTTTTAIENVITTSATETYSRDPATFTAHGTLAGAEFGGKIETATAVVLKKKDGVNYDTYGALTTYSAFDAVTFQQANNATFHSRQTYVDGAELQTASETRTRVAAPHLATVPDNAGLNQNLAPAPLSLGIREPGQIAQNDGVGSNLIAAPDQIFYPFTSYVQSGVIAPVKYRERRTAANGGVSWRYAWSGDVLSYSSRTASGDYTTGSASFATDGTATTFYTRETNNTFGGHGIVTGQLESVYRQPGAYMQTSFDQIGGETTTKGLRDFSSAAHGTGTIIVENALPYAVAQTLAIAEHATTSFTRNGTFDTWG